MDIHPSRTTPERLNPQRGSGNRVFSSTSLVRTGLWSLCHFIFYFAQQVAELLAPLFLILGIGWAILPHVVNAVTTSAASADPQARDIMNHVSNTLPTQLQVGSHLLTPGSLIFDGFLLMALAAIGATLSAYSARNM